MIVKRTVVFFLAFTATAAVFLAFTATPAFAQNTKEIERAVKNYRPERPPPTDENKYRKVNLKIHMSIAGAALATWLSLEVVKNTVAPLQCRWCDADSRGYDRLNILDRKFREVFVPKNPKIVDWASHGVTFLLLPVGASGLMLASALNETPRSRRWRRFLEDMTVMWEMGALTSVTYQVMALLVGRQRPEAHFRLSGKRKRQDNLGFPSGHVAFAFAITTAAGTILEMRNSKYAKWAWAVGLPLSVANIFLRVGAEKHFFTDAIVGMALGTLMGWAIPYIILKTSKKKRWRPELSFGVGKNQAGVFLRREF